MAISFSYPGVYIEEVASGVRTITGVATSRTAFIGWAPRGATDRAVLVSSWMDYERNFGGLDPNSVLGQSVRHFFSQGGQEAYIVRLANRIAAQGTVAVAPTVAFNNLTFTAANEGKWAEDYGLTMTPRAAPDQARFRIEVVYRPQNVTPTPPDAVVESFENLSLLPTDPRFVERVINTESRVVRVQVGAGAVSAAQAFQRLVNGDDGVVLVPDTTPFETNLQDPRVQDMLTRVDIFNLLCIPAETTPTVIQAFQTFCRQRRAFMIVDCKESDDHDALLNNPPNITGADAINSAFYFPWVIAPNPLQENRPQTFPPSGFVAGQIAKNDSLRGIWKAPAGTDVSLTGVSGLDQTLTDIECGHLNVKGFNCLRDFRVYGNVIWGARTLRGDDEIGSEWKYIPVRRTALYIEESLYRGTKWAVFEPNDEPLWAQLRLNVGAFMHSLYRQGAFQGSTPRIAYEVRCDSQTTTQDDINRGIVNIVVKYLPLKPAEYVCIRIAQLAGQIQT